ncbi:MAG: DNA repair protein RecN [Gammaproteobacteria bacterium]|nr:DNA repair protein RecN [Gammaproteobacteria bacterium]MDP2141872.1 DNA repair protein RecN [Gammaproteobacteria bacterium]MDP2348177.1 DNA repair protein RecN [Gammaproteobacteria bacterium]
MLTQLSIRHYAIVDHLEIDFRPGMTVITGETGAGKSIILGALGLTLGDRADKGIISSNASKADITAHFDTNDQPLARAWLEENELLTGDDQQECLLRRVVSDDGRSKAWVNGFPVTLQVLKTIGEMLIDIHSQHEHQSLLDRATHLRLLDEFIGDKALVEDLRQVVREWKKNRERLEELSQQSEEFSAQVQLISYQLNELDELALEAGELESLDEEYRRLNSADTTLAAAQQLLDMCCENDEHTLQRDLNQALHLLQELATRTRALDPVAELLNTASIQIDEAIVELRRSIDDFEANPLRLEEINQRLAAIHQIARKHRLKPDELASLHHRLRQQLDGFQHSDEALAQIAAQDRELKQRYLQLAEKLSQHRQNAGMRLAEQINLQIAELGMSNARLSVALTPGNSDNPSPHGLESVEFLVSTNPGQEPRPLLKIASGGELSRISLAIQVITAQTSSTPTLVFDEVDVGIGGGVARSVGRLLRELGGRGQVLCVTHQAQVASQGHQHLFVSKLVQSENGKAAATGTRIRELSSEEKIREIARMLGGESGSEDFTPESLAHAQEMLSA